jgi:hypothetical protein
MVAYVDSSVVLRHILLGDVSIRQAVDCEKMVSSELLEVECRRVIQRCRLEGELDDDGYLAALDRLERVLGGISLITLGESVKKRAMGAFPLSVKTLDALHLASALVLAEREPESVILVFSHDVRMNRCAKALGFGVPLSL